ncbi:hypothetical protein, partial [Mangrovicoccus sp. HB161399]|uniref:hypothetical protein n=1 Tax=Mangrovicoccus sp. HB161399 TaxID=2720392 RepID=UPI00155709F0
MQFPSPLRPAAALLCFGTAASAQDANPDRLWESLRIAPPEHDCDFKEFGEGRDKLCYYYTANGRLRVIFLRQVSWGLPHGLPPEAAVELVADPVGYWSRALLAKEREAALCCDEGQAPDGRETRHDFSLMKRSEIPVVFKVVVTGVYFQAAHSPVPAMGPPRTASLASAPAAPWPRGISSGRSGLSQTEPIGVQQRVPPDHRSGRAERASS